MGVCTATVEMISAASLMGAYLGAFFGVGLFIILTAFSDWLTVKFFTPPTPPDSP